MKTTPRFLLKFGLIVLFLGAAVWRIIPGWQHPKVPVEVSFQRTGAHIGARTINGFSVYDNTYPLDKTIVSGINFANKRQQPLAIDIKVSNPVSQKTRSEQMILEPNSSQELGSRQGWQFAADDVITINSAGYRQGRFAISP
jgi:hypothetical protein